MEKKLLLMFLFLKEYQLEQLLFLLMLLRNIDSRILKWLEFLLLKVNLRQQKPSGRRLEVKPSGSIPDVVPPYWAFYNDNMTWPGAFLTVADMLYERYGDTESVVKYYPAMKKWLAYMKERYGIAAACICRTLTGSVTYMLPSLSLAAGMSGVTSARR